MAAEAGGSAQSGRPPLIGVTSYLEEASQGVWNYRAALLPETYLQAVLEAGGIPLLLPPQPAVPEVIERVLDALDGLVLSGGADVNPALYGQQRHPETQTPRLDRDAWEQALLQGAIERDLPFLAICRGVQMLNVALGGSLHQHLPDVVGSDKYAPAPATYGQVQVDVSPASRLHRILGEVGDRLTVHAYHHQALDVVAEPLTVSARSEDGVVEAVELGSATFGIGVQWHPEQDAADRRLFAGLVGAASAAGGRS